MTTVTQTEAFAKLDEGTVKDFIMKVQKAHDKNMSMSLTYCCRLRRLVPSNPNKFHQKVPLVLLSWKLKWQHKC